MYVSFSIGQPVVSTSRILCILLLEVVVLVLRWQLGKNGKEAIIILAIRLQAAPCTIIIICIVRIN